MLNIREEQDLGWSLQESEPGTQGDYDIGQAVAALRGSSPIAPQPGKQRGGDTNRFYQQHKEHQANVS